MNLKKLIMLGCFALSLAACGGSTSQDNNNGVNNPGGDQNPAVVTPVATPEATPEPTPEFLPEPTPTPSEGKRLGIRLGGPFCDNGRFDAAAQVLENGDPVSGVDVEFKYKAETLHATTNSEGWATVGFAWQGEDYLTAKSAYGEDKSLVRWTESCAGVGGPSGEVAGVTTDGQILAAAGTSEENFFSLVFAFGAILVTIGLRPYALAKQS